MDLVIDANVIISALIPLKSEINSLFFFENIELYAPEFLSNEISKYKEEILSKSNLSKDEFYIFLALITSKIKFIPFNEFNEFIPEAREISYDPKDIEYLALALKLKCAIWSNDKDLKKQNKIKIFSTSELLKELV
jgi:predicted nucleic acid-binding protein